MGDRTHALHQLSQKLFHMLQLSSLQKHSKKQLNVAVCISVHRVLVYIVHQHSSVSWLDILETLQYINVMIALSGNISVGLNVREKFSHQFG
jgi:uncharacterized protein YebE (UPF0316 family)